MKRSLPPIIEGARQARPFLAQTGTGGQAGSTVGPRKVAPAPRAAHAAPSSSHAAPPAHAAAPEQLVASFSGDPSLEAAARDHVQAAGLTWATEAHAKANVRLITLSALRDSHAPAPYGLDAHAGPALIVLTDCAPGSADFELALAHRALAIRTLPEDSAALLADLTSLTPVMSRARMIACMPGHTGAGATHLAARLAGSAHRQGAQSILVDCDPLSGGMDAVVDARHVSGARWDALATAGDGSAHAIVDALPLVDGVRLLTYPALDAAGFDTAQRVDPGHVIAALAGLDATVIIDTPAPHTSLVQALEGCEILLVLAPSIVSIEACGRRLAHLRTQGLQRVSLAVRHPRKGVEWDARELEAILECPVALEYHSSRPGITPLLDVRRSADRPCDLFLEGGPR